MAFATIHYFSQSLRKASSFNVIFPDDPKVPKPWSTFLLLHGLSDDHTIWARRTSIERYVEGYPLVVVMPDGGRGWYTNAKDPAGPRYEDDLMIDVLGLVERTFPVRTERAGRAIGGLSMGGFGAIKLGLKHPKTFASVNSHSGAIGVARYSTGDVKDFRDEYLSIFGEAPTGGPEDCQSLAERVDHGLIPSMRIDCGVKDDLLEDNRSFHRHLESLHIPHEYAEFPGAHNWEYWDDHVQEAVMFHARNLGIKKI